ncbi:MAG: hypothetical protein QXU98_09570 [Candidatus Parvarchaeota archaeon]
MKTSSLIIAIIGIAIIGYLVYKYVYLPRKTSTTTSSLNVTTPSSIPSTVSVSQYVSPSSSSTSSTSTPSNTLTSVTQNYYTPPSNGLLSPSKTSQISFAQQIACQRYPQLCAKEAPYLFNFKGPVTAYSPSQSSSSSSTVHQSNPSTISTGIGKYIRPMGGPAYNNWGSSTVNRNSYSFIQQTEKSNFPFMQKISAITTTTQPQKTTTSSSLSAIHRPILPTLSELKKQNPYLR